MLWKAPGFLSSLADMLVTTSITAMLDHGRRKRPVIFSQKLFDDMMEDLMLGRPLHDICTGSQRPALRSFYRWLQKNPALLPRYRQARELSADSLESTILSHIATMPEKADNATVNLFKLRFDMLRWVMARRAPKRYGERQTVEHTGQDGGPLHSIQRLIIDPAAPSTTPPEQQRLTPE
ncbi:terminase small subunit-like protein [Bombella favorum]|nr:hypothetical protein [Bombella favorum]